MQEGPKETRSPCKLILTIGDIKPYEGGGGVVVFGVIDWTG